MIDSETRAWIEQTVRDEQTDSAFHDDMPNFDVRYKDRRVAVTVSGEMRYLVGDKDIRDSLGLIEAGIDTDKKLYELDDSCRDMNNWFEIIPIIEGETFGLDDLIYSFTYEVESVVCHLTTELESAVTQLLTNDEWWKEIAA